MADELTLKDIFDIEGFELSVFGDTAAIIDAGDGDIYRWFDAECLTDKEKLLSLADDLFSEEQKGLYCELYEKETGHKPDISKIKPMTQDEVDACRRTDAVLATLPESIHGHYKKEELRVAAISVPEVETIDRVAENVICGRCSSNFDYADCSSFCFIKKDDKCFCFLGVYTGKDDIDDTLKSISRFMEDEAEGITEVCRFDCSFDSYGFDIFISAEQTALFADEILKAAKEFTKAKKKEDRER